MAEKEKKVLKSYAWELVSDLVHPDTGETLVTTDKVEEYINKYHRSIQWYHWVIHNRDPWTKADKTNPRYVEGGIKPVHLHFSVFFKNNQKSVEELSQFFGIASNFFRIISGGMDGMLDSAEYDTHESEYQQSLGKALYQDDEIRANYDWRGELEKRKANRLKYGGDLSPSERMIWDVFYDGKTLRQCECENKALYLKNYKKLCDARLRYIASMAPPDYRINYYISGEGRQGKGAMSKTIARALYPDLTDREIFFEVGAENATFEGYDGQPIVIWHDRRAYDLIQELGSRNNVFNVFDSHPTGQRQNIKYGSINLCNVINIVNSVQPCSDFLDGLCGEYIDRNGDRHQVEDKKQSYGRFPCLISLSPDGYYYDYMYSRGFSDPSCRYDDYESYRQIEYRAKEIYAACKGNKDLANRILVQSVQIIVDKHKSIVSMLTDYDVDEAAILAQFSGVGKSFALPFS